MVGDLFSAFVLTRTISEDKIPGQRPFSAFVLTRTISEGPLPPAIGDLYNQKVHFTTGRCTLQPRGTLQPGSCKKVVSVKLFWKLAGALETVCICKGTLDSRIMLVAKLAQMAKTMVFDASGNQLRAMHSTLSHI